MNKVKNIIAILMAVSNVILISCGSVIDNSKETTMILTTENSIIYSDLENSIIAEINEVREARGLSILNRNEDLNAAAAIRAQELAKSFSHTRPDGSEWWTVSKVCMGECLARGNENNINRVVEAWQLSPTHNALLLDDRFKNVGISIYELNDTYYVALELGK